MKKNKSKSEGSDISRRRILKASGAGGFIALAGCLGDEQGDNQGSNGASGGEEEVTKVTPSGGESSGEPIKIGLLTPFSGSFSTFGQTNLRAAQLAQHEINEAGGIDGRPVTIMAQDSGTNPQQALSAFQTLDSQNVLAIVGFSSVVAPSLVDPIQDAGIVTTFAGGTTSLDEVGGEWIFRTVGSDSETTRGPAKYMKENGYENVGIMYIDTDDATSAGLNLAKSLDQAGVDSVTKRVKTQAGTYKSEISQMMDSNPDFFVFSGGEASFKVAVRDYVDMGIDIPFITDVICCSADVIDSVGPDLMEGVYGWEFGAGPNYAGYDKRHTAFHGQSAASYSEPNYDAMNLFALALQRAAVNGDELTRQAVSDYMNSVATPPGEQVAVFGGVEGEKSGKEVLENGNEVDLEGAATNCNFDEMGDPIPSMEISQVQDGAWEVISEYTAEDLKDL